MLEISRMGEFFKNILTNSEYFLPIHSLYNLMQRSCWGTERVICEKDSNLKPALLSPQCETRKCTNTSMYTGTPQRNCLIAIQEFCSVPGISDFDEDDQHLYLCIHRNGRITFSHNYYLQTNSIQISQNPPGRAVLYYESHLTLFTVAGVEGGKSRGSAGKASNRFAFPLNKFCRSPTGTPPICRSRKPSVHYRTNDTRFPHLAIPWDEKTCRVWCWRCLWYKIELKSI